MVNQPHDAHSNARTSPKIRLRGRGACSMRASHCGQFGASGSMVCPQRQFANCNADMSLAFPSLAPVECKRLMQVCPVVTGSGTSFRTGHLAVFEWYAVTAA